MLGIYQHWIVDAWYRDHSFEPSEIEQAIADADAASERGYGRTSANDPDLREIADAWRETAILRNALGCDLDPWDRTSARNQRTRRTLPIG